MRRGSVEHAQSAGRERSEAEVTSQDRLFIGLAGPDMPEVRAELGKLLEEIANGDISVKPLTHAASTSTPT
jgi:hypothetical protein